MIPEESTTPDLVELTRQAFEAAGRNDVDALVGFYAADAVLDLSDLGVGTFEGGAALRTFLEDWWGTWGDHLIEAEEIVDLGDGVVFRASGKLVDSSGAADTSNSGWVGSSGGRRGMIERLTVYSDIDSASRAAAERLAASRG